MNDKMLMNTVIYAGIGIITAEIVPEKWTSNDFKEGLCMVLWPFAFVLLLVVSLIKSFIKLFNIK